MNSSQMQKSSVEALKSFNNAIVTSRLYPPDAPQVSKALEHGYKGIKTFLRNHKILDFSLVGDVPYLCGEALSEEVISSFPNLVVYRQLRLLQLPRLTLSGEMDRFAFGQLITVFNAGAAKIKEEGGGGIYITTLGLAAFFPDQPADYQRQAAARQQQREVTPPKVVKVRQEILAAVLGRDKRPTIEKELKKRLTRVDTATDVLVAGTAHVLRNLQKQKRVHISADFGTMVQRADTLLDAAIKSKVADTLAGQLIDSLRSPAVYVLLSQEFTTDFGNALYNGLIARLDQRTLSDVFVIFREQLAKAKLQEPKGSLALEMLGKTFLRLMETPKGKQFLSNEKAKSIIHAGELDRKKKRIEAGLKALIQGNGAVLKSEELLEYLPEAVLQLLKSESRETVESIVAPMAAALGDPGLLQESRLVDSAVKTGIILQKYKELNILDHITWGLEKAILRLVAAGEVAERAILFLHTVMQSRWEAGDEARGDRLLNYFHAVRSGKRGANSDLKALFAKVQDRGIKRSMLPRLLAQILANPQDKNLTYRLILQGPVASRFLVESLINAESREDRMVIIDMLTTQATYLPQVVNERLAEHMPWYGKRNLLKLLGECGGPEDAQLAFPYLRHEDLRVQREAFLTVYKIGGKRRKELLLEALDESSETIMRQIIDTLAGYCDNDVAVRLSQLLEGHEYFSEKMRTELILAILHTLGRCPLGIAHKAVQAFVQSRGKKETRKLDETVWSAAEIALEFLERELQQVKKQHVQASQLRKIALNQAAKMKKARADQRVITGTQQEKAIRVLLSQGQTEAASVQLLHLVERVARLRNFAQAEQLREWLIEIDPSAFSKIIHAAEIIDKEKAAAVDQGHLEVWSELYDLLSTEEFSDLYHSMQHRQFADEELLVRQGAVHNALFFINSGTVKLYFDEQDGEFLVKTLGKGEVIGASSVFETSVWTLSAASVGTSKVSVLSLEKLKILSQDHPGIENSLRQFCERFEGFDVIIEKSSKDRRQHERHRIGGRAMAEIVDSKGKPIGVSSKVELFDISRGGVSYQVRISQRDNARLLLGRRVRVHLRFGEGSSEVLVVIGDILAVRSTYAAENDFSVHVQFETRLRDNQLQAIVVAGRKEIPTP